MTDMGRIYMILGEPRGIERFETLGVFPCQAWSYYGDPGKNLPTHFVLIFFQKGGAGEYKLYDPVSDGPYVLIMDKKDLDPTDYSTLYDKIRELAPTLAEAAISIVPGEYNSDYSPSTRNSIVMAQILDSPKKDINPSYATHFMDYKGIVSTEYMTNFVESDSCLAVLLEIDGATEELRQGGEVRGAFRGLRLNAPVLKEFKLILANCPPGPVLSLDKSIPASELAPDYYELKLSLFDAAGKVLDEKTAHFIVSAEPAIGHPIANVKAFPLSNRFVYLYMLASIYDKIGDSARARSYFEEAYALNPQFMEGVAQYGNFLVKTGDFDKVLELADVLRTDDRRLFDYYFLKGRAHMGKGDYGQAIQNFEQGNRIYNSDTRVLNNLGLCFLRTGRKKDALEAFRASLKLNPQQPEISKLIAELGTRYQFPN